MLKRTALTDKFIVLGVDAMDPRTTKKYLDKGVMPNLKKIVDKAACRDDLVLLGANPTVTPPQWTTLSTGAWPMTHGVTGFYRHSKTDIDVMEYNLDSRNLQAEQLWDVLLEAGKRVLIFHWPGNSWPPTKDSENLFVIDGTNPGAACMSSNQVEEHIMLTASTETNELKFINKRGHGVSLCVIDDLSIEESKDDSFDFAQAMSAPTIKNYIIDGNEGQTRRGRSDQPIDKVESPIKAAKGWKNAPDDAKEFTILLSQGKVRRPALILKNENGVYDTVEIYKNKADSEPLAVLPAGKYVRAIEDDVIKLDDSKIKATRSMVVINLSEDGSYLELYITAAMDHESDTVFYPKSLFKTLGENVGYPPPTSMLWYGHKDWYIKGMLGAWRESGDWEADCINYMIENQGVECVFSHFHIEDLCKHQFIRQMAEGNRQGIELSVYEEMMEETMKVTDEYFGKFLHLMDKGWTIIITSDHAQVASAHIPPFFGDVLGVSINGMKELGYTVMKKDKDGKETREIDWEKTKAIAIRENDIYINTKGRWKTGCVEPEDQYELEEQIMTDLYGYRDKETGHRVIALALRNRDARLLGLGGPESGDIVYFLAEGYNYDHADSLSTAYGEYDTSASPIFIAAGPGIKEGFRLKRYVRQVDVAPTLAVLSGVRMPAQCEGAPMYEILTEEF